jgi:hypothetical protein
MLAHGLMTLQFLRACLVSNRVRLVGAKSASFTRRTASCEMFCRPASSVFEALLPKRAIRDRSSAYARTPKRFNPHPYQTGSKSTTPEEPRRPNQRRGWSRLFITPELAPLRSLRGLLLLPLLLLPQLFELPFRCCLSSSICRLNSSICCRCSSSRRPKPGAAEPGGIAGL